MYKQFDFDIYDCIKQNSGDVDLEYDVLYRDSIGKFEYVGFIDDMIYTKDGEIKPLKQFCKEVIQKYKKGTLFDYNNMIHEYYRVMNKFVPSTHYEDDCTLPVFLCQSCSSPENPIVVAPFYRIICVPRGE